MIDFPANPVKGQAFNPGTGSVYVFDGVSWNLAPVQLKTARARNRIINPTMQVSQENGGTAGTTSGYYAADQWFSGFVGLVSVISKSVLLTPTPEGTVSSVSTWVTTAKASLAAGDFLYIGTTIEGINVADLGWGASGAKQVVLRFFAVADVAGTYAFGLRNGDGTRTYLGTFTLAQAGVGQVFTFAIPGDTTGTWAKDTSMGIVLRFCFAAGSTFVGAAGWNAGNFLAPPGCINGAASINTPLRITDVGLYADPDNTGIAPTFVAPSFEDDLAACLRYWSRYIDLMNITYNGAGSGNAHYSTTLPVVQRVPATVSFTATTNYGSTGPTLFAASAGVLAYYYSCNAVTMSGGKTTATLNARM